MGLIRLQITSLLSLTRVASKEPQAAYAAGHAKMSGLFFIIIFQAVMLLVNFVFLILPLFCDDITPLLSNCACELL